MHPLLLRQLKKLGMLPERRPTDEQWASFLARAEQTYLQADQDRYMLERSLDTCSKEMHDLYDRLQRASAEEIAKKSVELEASLALAHAIQESVAEGIAVLDGERVITWNARLAEMWGLPEALLARPTLEGLVDHVSGQLESPERFRAAALADVAGPVQVSSSDIELQDGRTFVRYTAPITSVAGVAKGRIVCFRDVTEERRVSAQRGVVAERMASVGQLVASVAHEINNPLAYIKGNIEYVVTELGRRCSPMDGELIEALGDTCVGVDRIAVIVRDLRALSRVDEEARTRVDIAGVLESALQVANNQIRVRARVKRDFGRLPHVMANEGRLVQVFLNLLVNAAHAIPEGRTAQNQIAVSARATPAGTVRVEVRDSGSGIPSECLEQIFDPFYTTKPLGVGTGLGLSICKGIVEKLGGRISVESALGRGSCFAVELPAASDGERGDSARPAEHQLSASLRFLVVDDDAMVRRMLERMLREHVVVTATSVDEGVAAMAGAKFDIILCDVMMPDRTGLDMYAEVQHRWPELLPRLVFMSGGAYTPALQEFVEQPSIKTLEKPLSRHAVDAVVTKALGSNRPPS